MHPGVTVDEVVRPRPASSCVVDDVAETRLPDAEELRLIREVLDPTDTRAEEVPGVTHPALHTALCDLVGVRYPIVQTGMGWVAGPRLVAATANAGGLGILASATMTYDELAQADRRGQGAHRRARSA